MRTLHDPATRATLLARLDTLSADSPRGWGLMTAGQMLCHLNCQLAAGLDEFHVSPVDNAFTRRMLRYLVLYLMPWPRGRAQTPREMRVEESKDFEFERERFLSLVERFTARPLTDGWPRHPVFGPFSGHEWSRLSYRHFDHHFRQFGG